MDAIHYHVRSEDQIVKKTVCIAIGVNLEGGKSVLAEIRDKKYPKISKSWRENWANLSTYFKFPEELRRLIYTTNAIEGFNRQLRKVTKSKAVFQTDDSLFKMLYLAMLDITKKWTQDWAQIYPQLALYYSGRIPE